MDPVIIQARHRADSGRLPARWNVHSERNSIAWACLLILGDGPHSSRDDRLNA